MDSNAVPKDVAKAETAGDLGLELEELESIHRIGLDLIEKSSDLDELLDRVLEEYERRLGDLPVEALDGRRHEHGPETSRKLKALIMFATQAVALKAKAAASAELRKRAHALSEANQRLQDVLLEAQTARARLNGVLGALEAGVLLVSAEGTVLKANPAAEALLGVGGEGVLGSPLPPVLSNIPEEGQAEIRLEESAGGRVLLVSRRRVEGAGSDEVLMITDVTQRYRELEERHRLEKLAEVLRTLSVLSHKINNPLTALLGRAQLLTSRAGADPHLVKSAKVIEESALRIADLIRELATVVKEGRQEAVDKVLDTREIGMPEVRGS